MKTTPKTTETQSPADLLKAKNEVVKKAYFDTLAKLKELIRQYPSDYMRTYLEVDYSAIGFGNNHGFYSPLLHLCFEEQKGECSIYFAKNFGFKNQVGLYLDTVLTRCIYESTAATATLINIEDTLNVSLFRVEDYLGAKRLLEQGMEGCQKVTLELLKQQA